MDSSQQQVVFRKLAPFFLSVAVYFVLLIPYETPSTLAVIVKCTPIISLMYLVVSLGFTVNGSSFSKRILTGLTFCCLGDALLLFGGYFIYGMVAFIFGHVQYIRAFGWDPLKPKLGMLIYLVASINILILFHFLPSVYLVGVPIYVLVISTMVWRAIARVEESWTWIQISTCLGSILFAISDFLIGINMFVRSTAHSQALIMSSYYAAQLGISLSVLEAI